MPGVAPGPGGRGLASGAAFCPGLGGEPRSADVAVGGGGCRSWIWRRFRRDRRHCRFARTTGNRSEPRRQWRGTWGRKRQRFRTCRGRGRRRGWLCLRGRGHGPWHSRASLRRCPDGHPRCERDGHPALARRRGKSLVRVPAKHLRAGERAGCADDGEGEDTELRRAEAVARDAGLKCLDGVAARKERGETLRPLRQRRERDGNAADDQHRQEDALPERLHRRHGIRHHRDHQAEADEREGDERECNEELDRVLRHRHADAHGQQQLDEGGDNEQKIAGGDGPGDQRGGRDRRQAIAPPDATLAFADHGRRQSETRAAERGDRQQLADVADERDFFKAVEHPERHQEDRRKQIAVDQRHLVSRVQPAG